MHVFYLHGFASSARSSKASFLASRLEPYGVRLYCPDFNEPDFFTLTVTRMIGQVERAVAVLPRAPVALIGSSLGAFVALHLAARAGAAPAAGGGPIEKLILLAPALDFGSDRMPGFDEATMARWRQTNELEVFHHALGETRTVHYGLCEDARRYDSFAVRVRVPILIFQGLRDESVDPDVVVRFTRDRPNVQLRLLDDGHQLLGSLETIWQETAAFLGITGAGK